MTRTELRAYMRAHRLAVIGTTGPDGAPQAALVGIAVTDSLEVIFDTMSDTRKHRNLCNDSRIALTLTGPDEKTLQYEGRAVAVSPSGAAGAAYREVYYDAWPDGRERATWPKIAYWRVRPCWARFSDYNRGPFVVEFAFGKPAGL